MSLDLALGKPLPESRRPSPTLRAGGLTDSAGRFMFLRKAILGREDFGWAQPLEVLTHLSSLK